MKLSSIADLLKLDCKKDRLITGICIDSRKVQPGNLFIALQGERFDGHQFISDVAALGAAAVICNRLIPGVDITQFVVADTQQALAQVASYHRDQIDCRAIALTGSNGKTTVKEMIACILPPPAFATPGNLNNHIGVPLSLLQLQPEHHYAVFELGASHRGEIAYTVAMVKPQVTYINNIAPAHIEGFGSIDGVAHAKGEIHQGLQEHGTAVINQDDDYANFWDPLLIDKKVLRFSVKKTADIYASNIKFNADGCAQFDLITPQGHAFIQLNVPGAHNVSNAVAAATCTYALGLDLNQIVAGLSQFKGVSGRMTFLQTRPDLLIIDDTYNANLLSVLTAINVLSARKGTRILVFGDMGELGTWTEQHHQEVGIAARNQGIDYLFTCGSHSEATTRAFDKNAHHYVNQQTLVQDLLNQLHDSAIDLPVTVLVKGSRSSAMDKVVKELIAAN